MKKLILSTLLIFSAAHAGTYVGGFAGPNIATINGYPASTGFVVGGHLGYRWNRFSIEGETAYRYNRWDTHLVSGKAEFYTLMGNCLFDLVRAGCFRIQVGAGLGIAAADLNVSKERVEAQSGFWINRIETRSCGDVDAVAQAIIGVGVKICPGLYLKADYRLFTISHVLSHSVLFGLETRVGP